MWESMAELCLSLVISTDEYYLNSRHDGWISTQGVACAFHPVHIMLTPNIDIRRIGVSCLTIEYESTTHEDREPMESADDRERRAIRFAECCRSGAPSSKRVVTI